MARSSLQDHAVGLCQNNSAFSTLQDETIKALHFVAESSKSEADKATFFTKARWSLGRTGLCLSGGGSLAMYHMGVVRVMLEHQVLPRVISGSSGGSIIVGMLAIYNDTELLNDHFVDDIAVWYR